jgi:heme oxygenase
MGSDAMTEKAWRVEDDSNVLDEYGRTLRREAPMETAGGVGQDAPDSAKPMPIPAFNPGVARAIETLRSATRSRHAKLASCPAMARLFDPDYSVSEYRIHLGRLLGLFDPLEGVATAAAKPSRPVCALRNTRKTERGAAQCLTDLAVRAAPFALLRRSLDLREDLQHMGVTAGEIGKIERCRHLPPITTAGLHGYTYVMLGSMLGGKIIAKRLRAVLGPGVSLQFYGNEKTPYEALWASFCQDLEETGRNDLAIICDTAVALFDLYDRWLREPLSKTGIG